MQTPRVQGPPGSHLARTNLCCLPRESGSWQVLLPFPRYSLVRAVADWVLGHLLLVSWSRWGASGRAPLAPLLCLEKEGGDGLMAS